MNRTNLVISDIAKLRKKIARIANVDISRVWVDVSVFGSQELCDENRTAEVPLVKGTPSSIGWYVYRLDDIKSTLFIHEMEAKDVTSEAD